MRINRETHEKEERERAFTAAVAMLALLVSRELPTSPNERWSYTLGDAMREFSRHGFVVDEWRVEVRAAPDRGRVGVELVLEPRRDDAPLGMTRLEWRLLNEHMTPFATPAGVSPT